LLTSKEVLEATGISRATLNNYISWGIVPRPDVLPPEPSDGAAPRIGYFPDDIVGRIEEIQRLKREGWSITRISAHFRDGSTPAPAAHPPVAPARRPPAGGLPGLSVKEVAHPAYMVDSAFHVVWLNEAARSPAWPNCTPLPEGALSRPIFSYLLEALRARQDQRDAILAFHLGLAKQAGARLGDLGAGLSAEDAATLARLFDRAEPVDAALVAQAPVPAGGAAPGKPVTLFAVQFHEGILFLYAPGQATYTDVPALLAQQDRARGSAPRRRPAQAHVAILATDLQHADRLWSELPAEEYFELVNQVWSVVDGIFRTYRGVHGKHPADGMVGYFLAQPGASHLWDAIAAACQLREAMRRLSREWQLRKGWATELHMNTGIDEGQEWIGTLRQGADAGISVLGDAADHALHISNFARSGAVWVTRNLVGRLRPEERRRLAYGVRRPDAEGRDVFVQATFRRVEDLADLSAAGNEGLGAVARLPITEITGIAPEAGPAEAAAARPAA
jgi:adenylate cyclase